MTTAPSASASLAERLDGLLFFPVTAYGPDGALDLDVYRTHVRRGIEAGAGPFRVLRNGGVPRADPRGIPRLRHRGGGRGRSGRGRGRGAGAGRRGRRIRERRSPSSTPSSRERAGADGLLAMPPYLVVGGSGGAGPALHRAGGGDGGWDIIVYQRDNAVFAPETVARLAQVPGDHRAQGRARRSGPDAADRERGAGGRESGGRVPVLQRAAHRRADRARVRAIGVTLYSSAVFCSYRRSRSRSTGR